MLTFSMTYSSNLLLVLAISLFFVVFYVVGKRRHCSLYPPGPPKLFLLGNLLDIPTKFEWETYWQWSRDYKSAVVHAQAAGHHIVVLHTVDAANELLDKRSAMYSSRPRMAMISELMGYKWFLPIIPYGKEWKDRRRLFQSYFSSRNLGVYQGTQRKFVHKALSRILRNPEEFLEITESMVGGSTISLTYGLDVKESHDPFVDLSNSGIQSVAQAGAPGTFLVDLLPWLKHVPEWVPGAGFKKTARIWRKLQEAVRELPFAEGMKALGSSHEKPSFLSECMETLDDSQDREVQIDIIKDTLGSVFAAGSDTTLSAVQSFFVAMLFNPEAQVKAQQELDRVLNGRLPDFDDEAHLPYTTAIVKEVLRWKPVSPLGVPHCAEEDDIFRGYFIPKGAIIVTNLWAMLYDEERYPDPHHFNPERFLTDDGQLDPTVLDPAFVAFGFGRRLCPGRNVATSILWLTAATILATFEISKGVDENGRPVEPSVEYGSGLIHRPLPFKCTIKPRSKAAEELIRSLGSSSSGA